MKTTRIIRIVTCVVVLAYATSDVRADFTFGEPVNLRTVIPDIDPVHESISCLSSDGHEIYLMSDRPGGQGGFDLWVLKRNSIEEDWGPPMNLGPDVNGSKIDSGGSISSDGLTLYFYSNAPGGYGGADLYMTARATTSDPWSQAVNLGATVNGSATDLVPVISHDGLELYFTSWRSNGHGVGDTYVTRRATTNDPWGEPENLGDAVNTPYQDLAFSVSPDGRLLFFSDNVPELGTPPRPGGRGGSDMWMTRRASLSDPWQVPVNLGPEVNTSTHEMGPVISPDGSTLYFSTARSEDYATWENWQAPILPIVDFNADEVVDLADLVLLIDNWGTDNTLYDIGPYAWGDGVVDIEDLKVFITHWEKASPANSQDEQ